MNPQRSFIQTLIVPFLIGMWIFASYLVYKTNPEIMSQESLHSTLTGPREQSESRVNSRTVRDDLYTEVKNADVGRLSHRYVEIKDESFKPLPLASHQVDWHASDNHIIIKEKTKVTVAQPNGDILWTFTLPGENVFTDGMAPLIGSALYLTTTSGRVYAFDIISGQMVWYMQSQYKYFHSPLVTKNELLLFVEQKSDQSWALQVVDAQTGEPKKTFSKLEMPLAGTPVVSDGFIYFATQNGHLNALNLEDDKSVWSTEASSSFRSGPASIGERIYLTNEDGLALGFDRKNGRKVNEVELGSSIQEPLQLIEGTNIAITVDTNGYLIAVDLKLAKRLWRYNLNMLGTRHPFGIYKLSTKTLTQLNFVSEMRGWSVWTACSTSRICIFDVKEGRMLHRIELRAEPVAQFEFVGTDASLLVPVKHGSGSKIIGFRVPVLTDSTSTLPVPTPDQPVVDK